MLYSFLLRNFGLPWVSKFTDSKFWDMYKEFVADPNRSILCTDPGIVLQRTRSLLEHAYRNVPFYRDRMRQIGFVPADLRTMVDLEHLPATTKSDINANFPDRMTDASGQFKPWRYRATSGTIERLTVIQDFRKRQLVRTTQSFAYWYTTRHQIGMKYMDIPPDVCRNVCGAKNEAEPGFVSFLLHNIKSLSRREPETISDLRGIIDRQLIDRCTTLPAFGDGGAVQSEEALRAYIDQIKTCRPYVLKGLPVYLYGLADYIETKGLRPPRIRGGLLPLGGLVSPYMKQKIERGFANRLHEDYGCAELGGIAAECGSQSGLHPFSGLFHVEVVKNGRPAEPGESGKVLITDLYNFAMPFIRYEIGDLATVAEGPCKCGLNGLRFRVQGRVQDSLIGANGQLIGTADVTDILLKIPGVYLFQVDVHGVDDIDLQIVPSPHGAPDLEAARHAIRSLLPKGARVACRLVPTILPESGGKYRFIRNTKAARVCV